MVGRNCRWVEADAVIDHCQARRFIAAPQGAFYAFPNITGAGLVSGAPANLILEKAGVARMPGSSFGQCGEGYLRLSYANSSE